MSRVLVTGEAGFIGLHVTEAFAHNWHEVVVFDNLSREKMLGKPIGGQEYNWNYLGLLGNIIRIMGDVCDFAALSEATMWEDSVILFMSASKVYGENMNSMQIRASGDLVRFICPWLAKALKGWVVKLLGVSA